MSFVYRQEDYEREVRGYYNTGTFEIYMSGQFHPDLSCMSQRDLGTFFHEYVHFLQNITTLWGIRAAMVLNNDLCEFAQSLREINEIHIPYKFQLSEEQELNRKWLQCSMGTTRGSFTIDRNIKSTINICEVNGFPVSIHYLKCRFVDTSGIDREVCIGATIIKESMAAMCQSIVDPSAAHPDVPYNVVKILAEHHFPNIANDIRKLICLCFVALYSLDPGCALIRELRAANQNPSLTCQQIFENALLLDLVKDNQYSSVLSIFDDFVEQYKQSLRNVLPFKLSYTGYLLDRIKLHNKVSPILDIVNATDFSADSIKNIIGYLGIPFIHQADGRQFYPSMQGNEHLSQDIITICGNNTIYRYFTNPDERGGICPFKNICGCDDMECWAEPWKHNDCIFECGLSVLGAEGKKIIKNK